MNAMNPSWTWRPLGELFEIGAGKTMSAAARSGAHKIPFLRTSNVLWDEIDLSSVDEMSIPEHELPAKLLQPGDLLVCEGGEIGRAAIWNGEIEPMAFQNHLHRLRPVVREVEPHFYVYFLQSAFTQLGLFQGSANKTTIPNLSRSRLAALEVPLPTIDEQRAIVTILGLVRKAIVTHDKLMALTRDLKHVTTQRLFTRGLRKEAQKETEIGLMPESWRVINFHSVCDRIQYGTSTRCTHEPLDYPVLRIPNVETDRINPENLKYCQLPKPEAKKFQLEVGDLIFIRTNGSLTRLGSCAVYHGEPAKALFASYLIRARLKLGQVNPHFVGYFLGSELGISIIAGRVTPASDGKYNLNTGTINNLLLPLPPTLNDQRGVVAIIEAIERKIDLHHKKRAVFDDLFKVLLHRLMTGEVHVNELDLSLIGGACKFSTRRS